MSQSAVISSPTTTHPQLRRIAPRSRLSRREVEALLYDAVADALGIAKPGRPDKLTRRSVAAATRQLETA
jgi:hypothetical protein